MTPEILELGGELAYLLNGRFEVVSSTSMSEPRVSFTKNQKRTGPIPPSTVFPPTRIYETRYTSALILSCKF